jgi:ABC-type nitrate/sulfonate/bicarbonate transport system substrate-binding protein
VLRPKDLVGARILSQNTSDKQIIDTILGNAGLPLTYKLIPTGFSPEPLLNGDGDAYLAFATNQPITLENMGLVERKDFFVKLMDDLGYHVKQGLLVTRKSYIDASRPLVVGYLRALVKGWSYACAHPDYAAKLVVDKYAADFGLDLKQQTREMQLQVPLVKPSPDTRILDFDTSIITGDMTKAAKVAGRTVPPLDQIVDLGPLHEAQAA